MAAAGDAMAQSRRRRRWTAVACAVLIGVLALSATGALLWRSSQRRQDHEAFAATAANVSATLGTLLHRDADFVTTMQGLARMQPDLSDSMFNAWYASFQGAARQLGGVGSALVESVPASRLSSFEALRNSDAAYRALVGSPLQTPQSGDARYCLISAAVAIVPLGAANTRWLQEDWCNPGNELGQTMAAQLREATDTGDFASQSMTVVGLPLMFMAAPVYRLGVPVATVAARRAASIGWAVSTFDVTSVIRSAIGVNNGLEVTLYHRNPGGSWVLTGMAGTRAPAGSPSRTTMLSINGDWSVRVRGAAVTRGLSTNLEAAIMFAAGALVAVLLFLLLVVLARSRNRALGLVEETTGQLRHQAMHDPLTDLPNRALALDRGEQMFARARRGQFSIAALSIDFDGFKLVNDTFGRAAGDECLRIFAERLHRLVREGDIVSRYSGDEFVVLISEPTLDDGPHRVAERVLETAREPFRVSGELGRPLSLTVSIGVARGLRESAAALLADADIALSVAKRSGKNRYVVFQPQMQEAAHDRLKLEMDLVEALKRDELFIVYQPTFELQSERTIGVEALLRWRHPTRGLIPPDVFIPIAEDSGLILPMGRWVLEQACRQAAKWHRQGHTLTMSVNVSAVQLEGDQLIDEVRAALEYSGLEPRALMLEITETTLMLDAEATAQRLAALKCLGVHIAVDDFGTGYSSLAYLRQFPVDMLKIDRAFIKGMTGSMQSAALIHTLVHLGKTLRLRTLAEGIEDRAQLRALQREECDYGQGYLFSRPLAVEEIEQFLDAQNRRALAS